ncbi:1133_t:CDS:2, partial [Gigaspora rosea]
KTIIKSTLENLEIQQYWQDFDEFWRSVVVETIGVSIGLKG